MKGFKPLALSLLLLPGCSHGPKVQVCLIDGPRSRLVCDDASTKSIKDAHNFVVMSPDDYKAVLDYARTRCE